ncbi:hypothetical protein ACHAWU_006137 [Discostella pseudostelligera]|uniref:Uncharacterized protein n=1 Tax=Discostella pseudostelligera TaxID=259834 RepID=A0ABD3M523_9STRA
MNSTPTPSTPFTTFSSYPAGMNCCPSTPRPLKRKMILSIDNEDIYVPTSHGHDAATHVTIHIADLPSLPFSNCIDDDVASDIIARISLKTSPSSSSAPSTPSSRSLLTNTHPSRQDCIRPVLRQRDQSQKNFLARCA